MNNNPTESPKNEGLPELVARALPFLRDEADKYDDDGSNEPLELAREIEATLAREASREGVGPKWYAGTQRPEPMTSDDTGCTTGLILFLSQPEDGGPTARQGVFDHCMRFFIDSATGKRADPDMWCFSPDATPPVPQRLAQGEVKGLAERVAIAIWHRWGDADRLTWEDEPEKVAFRDAAAEVIEIVAAALGAAKPQGAGNAVIEELRSILADAQAGGPPVGRGGYCLDCGKWTPKNHREAEDHKEDCMAAAEWDKRLKWRARLQTLIAATPQDEAKPQAGEVCPNCERLTDIHHCQACGADFVAAKTSGEGE